MANGTHLGRLDEDVAAVSECQIVRFRTDSLTSDSSFCHLNDRLSPSNFRRNRGNGSETDRRANVSRCERVPNGETAYPNLLTSAATRRRHHWSMRRLPSPMGTLPKWTNSDTSRPFMGPSPRRRAACVRGHAGRGPSGRHPPRSRGALRCVTQTAARWRGHSLAEIALHVTFFVASSRCARTRQRRERPSWDWEENP